MGFDTVKAALFAAAAFVMLTVSASAQTDTAVEGSGPPALPVATDGPPDLPEADGPPDLPTISYYIGVKGEKIGPLDEGGLTARMESGDLKSDTLVWTKGMDGWEKASTRDDLIALMAPEPAPVPAPSAFDAKTFVVGTWKTTGTTTVPDLGEANVSGTETFGADGSYSSVAEIVIENPPAQLRASGLKGSLILDVKINGKYKIISQTGKNYSIEATATVSIEDRNGLGLKNSEQATETIKYLALDANTFKDTEEDIVARRVN